MLCYFFRRINFIHSPFTSTMLLIAPDAFKDSLSAGEVCQAIQRGVARWNPELPIVCHPLADGGEGTLEVLSTVLELTEVTIAVQDPLFRPIKASYKIGEGVAYIEMARASGLELLKQAERNPLRTSTYGTGQLVLDALNRGIKKIYLFVGSSATNDAGLGLAAALGYALLDGNGQKLSPVGAALGALRRINRSELLFDPAELEMVVVADVQNPLYGPNGAAQVYAAQKGADTAAIALLDEGLKNYAEIVQRDLQVFVKEFPGAGAAGGLSAGAIAFCNATLQPGIQTLLKITDFDQYSNKATLLITGEGRIDQQTFHGKVVKGLCDWAQEAGIPIAAICGSLSLRQEEWQQLGLRQVLPIMVEGLSLEQAIAEAAPRIEVLAYQLAKAFFPK